MALELTKFSVENTPTDDIQVDVSTLDDSMFVSLVMSEDKALELAELLIKCAKKGGYTGYTLPDGKPLSKAHLETVIDFLKSRQKINAIKYLREQYKCGLKEVKDLADKIQSDNGISMGY